MNTILESVTGMNVMTDQVIARDLLNTCKAEIKTYATAVTETATPELKATLRKHLAEQIAFHEKITAYMMEKDWYKPYDLSGQVNLVVQAGQTALNVAQSAR